MKRYSSALILSVIILLGAGTHVWAQEQTPRVVPIAQQPQVQQAQLLTPQQLNNLVAPIALFPDPLLGQILVASTYPLEVVEASQWLARNKNLSGQALLDAAKQQTWDPSVQALVAFPDALAKLNQDIRWTTDLGNAFLAQEADVMSAVQQMRSRAQDKGVLVSTPQQMVTTEAQGGQQIIIIQPADPQVIYVPSYDPVYVWGPPVYGYYPPLYYPAFGFHFGFGFDLSFCFGGWGGWGMWGWGPNWFGHTVFINNAFFPHYGFHHGYGGGYGGRTIWAHDPVHRQGIPYGNPQIAERYRGPSGGLRNSYQAGPGSRAAAPPYANGYAERPGAQGSRNITPQPQRLQNQPQRYQAPQQRYQAPQVRSQAPQQGYQAPQARNQAPQQQRYQAPQQRYQTPQQIYQAPQQRYQAPQQFRSAPQQRYQAPQQSRSAPQMSPRSFSGGGGFSSGRGSSGGGSVRSGSGGAGGGGRRR
jgi:uncharacterized membrane protein YgcG